MPSPAASERGDRAALVSGHRAGRLGVGYQQSGHVEEGAQLRPADLPVAGDKYEQLMILARRTISVFTTCPGCTPHRLRGLVKLADWAVTHERVVDAGFIQAAVARSSFHGVSPAECRTGPTGTAFPRAR